MTVQIIFGLLLFSFITFDRVTAKPTGTSSYIEAINFEYKNDKWICGDIDCPAETFGCKIRLRSDEEDKKVVYQSFTCLGEDRRSIIGTGDRLELDVAKTIDINVESYVGAKSDYVNSYIVGGDEYAKGVIAADGLDEFKETARRNRKTITES